MHDISLEKWRMHGPYGLSDEYWTPKRLRERVFTDFSTLYVPSNGA